jgi:hypothetical protein
MRWGCACSCWCGWWLLQCRVFGQHLSQMLAAKDKPLVQTVTKVSTPLASQPARLCVIRRKITKRDELVSEKGIRLLASELLRCSPDRFGQPKDRRQGGAVCARGRLPPPGCCHR